MDFTVTESRMLYFHRVLTEEAERTPNLIARAREILGTLKARRADVDGVWAEWESLLAGPVEAIREATLADTPRGGLLRANSPIAEALSQDERNALWQRIGLHQFVALYLQSASDLGLTAQEQSAIVDLPEDEVARWKAAPPVTLTGQVMENLKVVVSVHRALERIHPDPAQRRAWLRSPVDLFAARPIELLASGHGAALRDYLTAAIQPLIEGGDRPSH